MRRLPFVLLVSLAIYGVLHSGCMDRDLAPVCPVTLDNINMRDPAMGGFDGVDMLLVVDNSSSMAQEQAILSSSIIYPC